ncbi:unnamed protein product [Phytomonas sp. EM1]|nr:unnamed protein product [Phytomonas sp. EM1]|eukprot:CCW63687.1 unnamed protein product [Phytomonas sp. isolate EM1]
MSSAPTSPPSRIQNPHGFWAGRQQHRPEPLSIPFESLPAQDSQTSHYGTFVPPLGLVEDGRGRNRFYKSATSPGTYPAGVRYALYQSPNQGSPYSIELKDHCHQQWIVVLLTILLFIGVSYQILIVQVPPTGPDCGSRFGTILGTSKRVTAYSNCKYSYRGEGIQNYVTVGLHRIYTGSKWGSVEYARRYWILRKLLTIPSLSSPEQLMNITEVMSLSNTMSGTAVPLEHFRNLDGPLPLESDNYTPQELPSGNNATIQEAAKASQAYLTDPNDGLPMEFPLTEVKATSQTKCTTYRGNSSLPKSGDLLVYAKDRSTLANGHVAVIVGVKGPYRQPDLNTGNQPLESREGQRRLATASRGSGAVKGSINPLNRPLNSINGIQADMSTTSNTLANGTESSDLANRTDLQSAYVYYKIYLAEQNWDNRPWAGEYKPMTGATRKYAPSTIAKCNMSMIGNGEKNRRSEVEKMLADNDELRNFSRMLILREYHPSCALYLEDTLGQRILGWVRPAPMEDA